MMWVALRYTIQVMILHPNKTQDIEIKVKQNLLETHYLFIFS